MGRTFLLLAALALEPAGAGRAQAPVLAPEDRQAILDYQLSVSRADQLITCMGQMTRYVVALPDFKERMAKLKNTTAAERLAMIEKDPKAMEILRKNRLTAKEYVVGVRTLRMAMFAARSGLREGMAASPANVEFARAHLADLRSKMDAVDGIQPGK